MKHRHGQSLMLYIRACGTRAFGHLITHRDGIRDACLSYFLYGYMHYTYVYARTQIYMYEGILMHICIHDDTYLYECIRTKYVYALGVPC